MKRYFRIIIQASLFLVFYLSLVEQTSAEINVYRPRIWVDSSIKNSLQQQVLNNTQEWQNLKSWCDSYLGKNLGSGYRGQQWHKAVLNYALSYQATGNQTYGNEGVKYLTALLDDYNTIGDKLGGDARFAKDDGGGNAFVSRFVGTGVAIGRDWLDGATNLDATLINGVGARIAYWLNYVKTSPNVYALHDPLDNFWSGHFAFFYTAAISTYGDTNYDPKWYSYAYETMWTNEALPLIQTFLQGGDWQEGFSYGPLAMRNIFLFQHAIETGTNTSILSESDWNKEIIRGQIHMLYPSRDYVSDDGSWSGNYKGDPRRALTLASAAMKNVTPEEKGLAKWYTTHLNFEPVKADEWELFLWRIENEELEPNKLNMGGLSYLTGSSRLLARSSEWFNQKATYVDFHAGPTGSIGNGEQNAGEFKISSRGQLLVIDGDTYQSESKYANVLLINGSHTYAPNQEWWKPNTSIDKYQETSQFVYARANNLNNAYDGNLNNNPSVSFYTRELFFLYPDYIFVMDSVVPTNPNTNTISSSQIHFKAEPVINGSSLEATNGEAKIFMNIRGHEINIEKVNVTIPVRGEVWNVLAKPATVSPNYKLLHVFQTAGSTTQSMDEIEDIIAPKVQGVHIGDSIVLFNKDEKLTNITGDISYTYTNKTNRHFIIGLTPGKGYSLSTITNGDKTEILFKEGGTSYVVSNSGILSTATNLEKILIPTIEQMNIFLK